MTGFGRGEAPLDAGVVSVEVRAVNSRFLDLRMRLPRELSALEAPLRAKATRYFGRGQVDVQVRLSGEAQPEARVEVDAEVARLYRDAAASLRGDLGLEGELDVTTLLGLPGVVRQLEPAEASEAVAAAATAAVEAACAAAVEMRGREGEALRRELEMRLERLEDGIAAVDSEAAEIAKAVRERLVRRVAQLAPELEVDPARLDQEIVLQADRMDVTEELVRLRSHVEQFREALGREGPIGRRLEFLLQEIGREVNTIGSKAQAARLASQIVDLKTELEKIREQVLNVE